VAAIAALLLTSATQAATGDRETAARFDMVRKIEVIARENSGGATATTLDAGVLEAMRRVPRHAFVPAAQLELAYGRTTAERSICANRTIPPMSSPPSGVAAIMVSARPSARRLTRRRGW
jgi:hypothetical protein